MSVKIIAELSSNHGGSLYKAQEMVMAAKWAGCDAVKVQLYGRSCLPDFDEASNIPICGWFDKIVDYCSGKIELIVSVFSWWGVEEALSHRWSPQCYYPGFEPQLKLHALKLASPESTRLQPDTYRRLARRIKEAGCPLFVSTGWADKDLICDLPFDVLFFCQSGYPAFLNDGDLKTIKDWGGFSDHTVGIQAPLAAIKAGASHIEKHFKLDDNCVDAAFSLNPDQMKMLCDLAK